MHEEARVFRAMLSSLGFHDDEGQDLVEYALLLGFIALASTAFLTSISDDIGGLWTAIAARLASTT